MNTFWLKIAGLAVIVIAAIIGINYFLGSEPKQPKEKPKTFHEVIEEDEKRLRAEPGEESSATKERVSERVSQKTEPAVKVKPQFKELSEIEKIEAEKLFSAALQFRKIGRLPGPSYKQMVDMCRDIIQRWPESSYAYKAKRMLADIPERYRRIYKITAEEINLDY